jgi:hypothetical protein
MMISATKTSGEMPTAAAPMGTSAIILMFSCLCVNTQMPSVVNISGEQYASFLRTAVHSSQSPGTVYAYTPV